MLSIWFHSHFSGMKGYPAAHGWYLSLRLEALAEPMDEVEDIRAAGHPCQNPELLVLGQMGMTVHTQWHGEQTKWRWGMLASSSRTQSELRPWNRALLHTNNGQQHPTANSEPWSRARISRKLWWCMCPPAVSHQLFLVLRGECGCLHCLQKRDQRINFRRLGAEGWRLEGGNKIIFVPNYRDGSYFQGENTNK